jgi:16S rRNA (uracil1498-N3)-methyltransferase
MPAFFVEKKSIINNYAVITGAEAKHIGQVLRKGVNDPICLFDEDGITYSGVIVQKDRKQLHVKMIEKTMPSSVDQRQIILCQALPKAQKMDLIVQKSTELGVSEIIPFFCSRSIPRLDQQKAAERLRHWQSICIAAIKQSGIRKVPAITHIMQFNELVKKKCNDYLKLIFWEEEKELTLRPVLSNNKPLKNTIFIIGPEGGFSKDEIDLACANEFLSVKLGKEVLRTETVSIAVLAIIRYEMGMFG